MSIWVRRGRLALAIRKSFPSDTVLMKPSLAEMRQNRTFLIMQNLLSENKLS